MKEVARDPEPVVLESSRLFNSLRWYGSWCDSESTRTPLRRNFNLIMNAAGRILAARIPYSCFDKYRTFVPQAIVSCQGLSLFECPCSSVLVRAH
jgi:hypothetical protein